MSRGQECYNRLNISKTFSRGCVSSAYYEVMHQKSTDHLKRSFLVAVHVEKGNFHNLNSYEFHELLRKIFFVRLTTGEYTK